MIYWSMYVYVGMLANITNLAERSAKGTVSSYTGSTAQPLRSMDGPTRRMRDTAKATQRD